MKTDREIEIEEQERAQRDLAAATSRGGGGFSPLIGLNKKRAMEREGAPMLVFAVVMIVTLIAVLAVAMFGAGIGLVVSAVIGMMGAIVVGVWRK